ncbi:MAG: hypothetical protein SVR08_14130 [Spirochaetota bacterium]|nr:hypothetical protein [Spirochaetota bacterium]
MTVIKCSRVGCVHRFNGVCCKSVVEIEFERCKSYGENLYRCEWCGKHVSKIYKKNRCYDCSIAYDFPDY